MPLYEYQCGKCGSVFEVMQKFTDEPLTVHENCGGAVERKLSAPALQFKGAGWYITDYAKSGSNDAKSAGDGEKSGETKPAESKSADSGSSAPASPAPSAKSD
jgi:putative FmdB family regulatory protein